MSIIEKCYVWRYIENRLILGTHFHKDCKCHGTLIMILFLPKGIFFMAGLITIHKYTVLFE